MRNAIVSFYGLDVVIRPKWISKMDPRAVYPSLVGPLVTYFIPQTELARRGSNGFGKGPWKVGGTVVVHFDQEKPLLGDTCSRLAYTKQGVASSNNNIYNRKSTIFSPDGSSQARPGPSPAKGQILEIWGPGNPEIWNQKHVKNENSQNPNPFCPKCRQGLD